jgi:hypothetical protein
MNDLSNLSLAVRKILMESESSVELRCIYNRIGDSFPLTEYQKDYIKHKEPRFHHEIRAILNQLVQDGEVKIVSRGIYRKT